jgi:hypothetical protein
LIAEAISTPSRIFGIPRSQFIVSLPARGSVEPALLGR